MPTSTGTANGGSPMGRWLWPWLVLPTAPRRVRSPWSGEFCSETEFSSEDYGVDHA